MSKPKFTDDFESNVRILARRKKLDSLSAVYEFATLETLRAIVDKRKDKPEFQRLRAYGDHLMAVCFVQAAEWNDEIAATIVEAMRPHLEEIAKFQRRQELEMHRRARKEYREALARERRSKSKPKRIAKAA